MELIFLGTGAAEGAPASYCRCATCQGVRERGGVELRTRSSVRVGPHHQIDLSPDHYGQTIAAGTDMYDVEHILITHTHEDHFTLPGLTDKAMTRKTNEKMLSVYLSKPAHAWLEGLMERIGFSENDLRWIDEHLAFVGLEYFHEYTIGGFTVQTIKGNHTARGVNEYSINYLLGMPHGKKLLYACDTGYYTDEAWEYLAGKRVDTLVLECTFAGRTDRGEFPGEPPGPGELLQDAGAHDPDRVHRRSDRRVRDPLQPAPGPQPLRHPGPPAAERMACHGGLRPPARGGLKPHPTPARRRASATKAGTVADSAPARTNTGMRSIGAG